MSENNEVIKRARAAEAKLREIAKTRRPTEAESAEALAAYEAAAKVTGLQCADCGRKVSMSPADIAHVRNPEDVRCYACGSKRHLGGRDE